MQVFDGTFDVLGNKGGNVVANCQVLGEVSLKNAVWDWETPRDFGTHHAYQQQSMSCEMSMGGTRVEPLAKNSDSVTYDVS